MSQESDFDRLIHKEHGNAQPPEFTKPPRGRPQASAGPTQPIAQQPPTQTAEPQGLGEEDDFRPSNGIRHDTFDWHLTKVRILTIINQRSSNSLILLIKWFFSGRFEQE